METCSIVLASVCICILISAIVSIFINNKKKNKNISIPPGPLHIPVITTIIWLIKPFTHLDTFLRSLTAKHGPVISIRIDSRPAVFIADQSLAHHALIHNASIFSDRPKPVPTSNLLQPTISSTSYGPRWRTLRRNLTSEMLHPSRVKSFSEIRRRVLNSLLNRLRSESVATDSIRVIDHIHYAMFSLLVFMCFGERVTDEIVVDIKRVQETLLYSLNRFTILNLWPKLTKILFKKRWEELSRVREDQANVLLPLIRARKQEKEASRTSLVVCYVDTLLELELPDEKRKLKEDEMLTLCWEFMHAGTDTTSTTMQWIMANLVKYPDVQRKLAEEIREMVGGNEEKEVRREDLEKLKYLKAVILEGLRRHPPGPFVLPHAVTEDVVLNGYLVPKDGSVNFMVAAMGMDPRVWEDPMEFKPERFTKEEEGFDITGSKEIKMMPFGAGRRMCPAYTLALLHLEYFVSNLVFKFDWKLPEGGVIDLSQKQEFTTVMKNPLLVHISPRVY